MLKTIFEKSFSLVTILMIACGSYLTADITAQISKLWFPMKPVGVVSGGQQKDLIKRVSLSGLLKNANFFDPNGGNILPKQQPTTPTKDDKEKKEEKKLLETVAGCPSFDPSSKIKETRIQMILKGTLFYKKNPDFNTAAISAIFKRKPRKRKRRGKRRRYYRRQERRVEMFSVGDVVMKARICMIQRKFVLLYNRGKFEKLTLYKKKKIRKKAQLYGSLGAVQAKESKDRGGGIRIDATDKFSISRKTVQSFLLNPMQHAMSARIMPHHAGGKNAGIRLIWIRKKSLYSKLGLKSGDVVQQINGKTLNLNSALGLYSELDSMKTIRVNVVRNGVRRQMVYNVK